MSVTADMGRLGKFVRHRRGVIGIRQSDIAEALGRPANWVSNLERGKLVEFLAPDEIATLANVLACAPLELLKEAGYPVGEREPTAGMERWAVTDLDEVATRLRTLLAAIESRNRP